MQSNALPALSVTLTPCILTTKFASESLYGGLIAPPTFFRSLLPGEYPEPYPEPFAHILDGGSKYRFFDPVMVGDQITVVRKITDLYEKSGRMGTMLFKISEISYTGQDGKSESYSNNHDDYIWHGRKGFGCWRTLTL
ncbi:MAG: hypothetical protein Ct9H300mP19_04250 [Dehalococcoidia bacterium]|nr:MAG: hypothetical protein Ct9H300mP19_04250 [Dehalococcoidia bacterium]